MKYYKLLIIAALSVVLLASCKKKQYDVNNIQGINADGELLLPICSKSLTMMEMMERFQLDSLISCSDDGTLSYGYFYEGLGVVKGQELLKFNDLDIVEHYAFDNPYMVDVPFVFDTILSFDQTIEFEAEHIGVLEAWMRSGRFDFGFESNIGFLNRVVLRSPDILDADGHELELDFAFNEGNFGFDLDGLRYETENPNTIRLSFDMYFSVQWTSEPELFVDVHIEGGNFVIREMRGYVETYETRDFIDTSFMLFPGNISGKLEINDARLRIAERNLFGLDAQLKVDTALVFAENVEPYSLLEPLPLSVNVPTQMSYGEVLSQVVKGTIDARGGRAYATYQFIVNPAGITDVVSVADTCDIDVQVSVDIPFALRVEDVHYFDTLELDLDEIKTPDLIEKLTIDFSFTSTLPLNLNGWFCLYDSQNEMIIDTLNAESKLISASFDGQPTSTMVTVEVSQDKLNNLFHSDHIIMRYDLDTDAHDVKLNANQKLCLFVKAKAEYNGIVEFDN